MTIDEEIITNLCYDDDILLGLCLGLYDQGRSSILLQYARDSVATAAESVTASRQWIVTSVKQRK